jgi:hypothetical protein
MAAPIWPTVFHREKCKNRTDGFSWQRTHAEPPKKCTQVADRIEAEFLNCEILEATAIFITRVAFFFGKRNKAQESSSAFMLS